MPVGWEGGRGEGGKGKGERVKEKKDGARQLIATPRFCLIPLPLPPSPLPVLSFVRAARGVVADLGGEIADAVLVEEVAQGADGELEQFGGARLVAAGAA